LISERRPQKLSLTHQGSKLPPAIYNLLMKKRHLLLEPCCIVPPRIIVNEYDEGDDGGDGNDIIVDQTESAYDEAGNLVSQASYQRLNDAPASGTGSTGALSYGTNPKARVSYSASWFDGIDRMIASANYGAIASFTHPSTRFRFPSLLYW
jgi:hypothetical protein